MPFIEIPIEITVGNDRQRANELVILYDLDNTTRPMGEELPDFFATRRYNGMRHKRTFHEMKDLLSGDLISPEAWKRIEASVARGDGDWEPEEDACVFLRSKGFVPWAPPADEERVA